MGYYSRGYYPGTEAPYAAGADLLTAIKARLTGTGIDAAVSSRIFLKVGSRAVVYPTLIIEEGSSSLATKTSDATIQNMTVRFRVYHETVDEAVPLATELESFWRNATVSFDGGWTSQWIPGDRRTLKDTLLSNAGDEVWYVQSEFSFFIKRG